MASHLILIGGGDIPPSITAEILARAPWGAREDSNGVSRPGPRIGVCTLASGHRTALRDLPERLFSGRHTCPPPRAFDFLAEDATEWDFQNKARHVGAMRAFAETSASVALLDGLDALFFSGGDQRIILDTLRGTRFEAAMRARFVAGTLLVAGTSAGLQVQSELALTGDFLKPQPRPDAESVEDTRCTKFALNHTEVVAGFGLLEGVILDQHFIVRGRYNRLMSAVLDHPRFLGLGVDEQTALCVSRSDGDAAQTTIVGNSGVFYADGRQARVDVDAQGELRSATGLACGILFPAAHVPFTLTLRSAP